MTSHRVTGSRATRRWRVVARHATRRGASRRASPSRVHVRLALSSLGERAADREVALARDEQLFCGELRDDLARVSGHDELLLDARSGLADPSSATVLGVKRDAAERIAATHGRDVSHEDAQNVINMFLRKLAECPACEDSGLVSYHRGARIAGEGADGGPGSSRSTPTPRRRPARCAVGATATRSGSGGTVGGSLDESCAPDAPASESGAMSTVAGTS